MDRDAESDSKAPSSRSRNHAGKPNVTFRKIVGATKEDAAGEATSVNAQSYTVLVMDVPDINKERRK